MATLEAETTTLRARDGAALLVRRATWNDMPLVGSMVRSSAEWYRPIVDPDDMTEHDVGPEWMEANYKRRAFYLGYVEGQAFGTISMQDFSPYCYIGYVYLDTDFVGRGLGRQLLRFAADEARQQGYRGLALIAHPEATWATKAYLKFGFRKAASRKRDVLGWQDGALVPYYEERFELYVYDFDEDAR